MSKSPKKKDDKISIETTDKDKKDPEKTFEFSVYSKDSIMTEFSVDVSLDSKMITQAMYHTNKDISTVGHSGMNSPESMGIQALSTLNNVSKTQTEIGKKIEQKKNIKKGKIFFNHLKFMRNSVFDFKSSKLIYAIYKLEKQ